VNLRAHNAPWAACIEFQLDSHDELSNRHSIAQNVEFVEAIPGTRYEPLFSLDHDKAQVLMDDLWNAGLRPTEGKGSAGSLRATEKHLDDMRRIVFGHLKSDNPQNP